MSEPTVTSPLEGLRKPLESLWKPASRGLAIALVIINVLALAWLFSKQGEALDRIQSGVGSIGTSVPVPADPTDSELCWLMGANAYAAGRGAQMSRVLSSAPTLTDCMTQAHRGALGQGPEG
jgi:hypothetical protein